MKASPGDAKKRRWWPWIVLALAVLGFVFFAPVFSSMAARAPEMICLSEAKKVALACKLYAGDNFGKFPQRLQDLVPSYLPEEKSVHSPFEPLGPDYAYQYFGGTENDPPDQPLLVAKTPKGKWIVIRVDMSGSLKSQPPEPKR